MSTRTHTETYIDYIDVPARIRLHRRCVVAPARSVAHHGHSSQWPACRVDRAIRAECASRAIRAEGEIHRIRTSRRSCLAFRRCCGGVRVVLRSTAQ